MMSVAFSPLGEKRSVYDPALGFRIVIKLSLSFTISPVGSREPYVSRIADDDKG